MKVGALETDNRVLIVAEIGNNHEGSFETAARLVEEAATTGADAVKFQTFRAEHYVSASDAERFHRLQSFQLSPDEFRRLSDQARARGLLFISTPFDLESAALVEEIADAVKIASGDNDFYPLIRRIASGFRPVILSTGLTDMAGVDRAVACIRSSRPPGVSAGLALLHCVAAYPVPIGEVHLGNIAALGARFPGATIGYSDHTLGIEAAVAAVAAGARIVEKHFTLDHDYSSFRDHKLSADPAEFRRLVERVRETERLLGSGEKGIQPCEEGNRAALRRSIATARPLRRGDVIGLADLTWIRPRAGLLPGEEDRLVGRRLTRDVAAGEILGAGDVEENG